MKQLYSLQGSLFLATRTAAGKPGAMWWAGNVEGAKLELTTKKATKNESFSGTRGLYGSKVTEKGGRLTGSFTEWLSKNMALGFYSTVLSVVTGTVSAEELPADLLVGDCFALDHPYASSLVITDSTGSPVTVPTTSYGKAVEGHNERTYRVLEDLSALTEPLKAAYSYAAHEGLEVFSEEPQEVYVIFDGIDTENDQAVVFDFYRTKFDPFANIGLIHEEYGSLDFGADILIDPLNFDTNGKGGYYKMRRKALT